MNMSELISPAMCLNRAIWWELWCSFMLHCRAPHHHALIHLADISYLSLSVMLSWGCTKSSTCLEKFRMIPCKYTNGGQALNLTALPTQSMISTQTPSALGYCTRRIENNPRIPLTQHIPTLTKTDAAVFSIKHVHHSAVRVIVM